jgi:GT2 family glycosyltransferase
MVLEDSLEIAVIVVNFRTPAETLECLESLLNLRSGHALHVVIVDNASGDDSVQLLSEWAASRPGSSRTDDTSAVPADVVDRAHFRIRPPHADGRPTTLTIVAVSRNLGFAGGVNVGLKIAAARRSTAYFWLLNSDTVVDPESLLPLLHASHQTGDFAIVGSTLVYYDAPTVVQAAAGAKYMPILGRSRHIGKMHSFRDVMEWDTNLKLDYIVGASMFFSRSVLDRVGQLPEQYFLYFEEVDWCATARQKGIVLTWAKGSRVLHKEGRSIGSRRFFARQSDAGFYYLCRNSMLYTWKKHPWLLPTVVVLNFLQGLRYLSLGDASKVRVLGRAFLDFFAHIRRISVHVRVPNGIGI